MGKRINSFDDAFSLGFRDVHLVATIVFRGTDDVPTCEFMGRPGAANSGGIKDEDFGAPRSKGREIEIEGFIELGFSR